jgi:orotate phosphoribosyltransferase
MHLLPTQEEVVRVLRDTGALRDGHFEYPSGLHSNEYLQVPLASTTTNTRAR